MTDATDGPTASRPSYVGSVLQEADLREGYFDPYTSTAHPMNVYSKFFAGKLGFKDVETARAGEAHLDRLTMFDRARGAVQARVYRRLLANPLPSSAP